MRLHTKFIVLLVSVSLVPLIVVAGVMLVRFQSSLSEEAAKLGHQLAAAVAADTRAFMTSQFGLLDSVAVLYQPGFPIEPEVSARLLEIMLLKSEHFTDISVVDADGQEIVRKNRVPIDASGDLRNVGETEAFEAVREHGVYVGPVYVAAGRPYFSFGRRILDAEGAFAGAVFAEVDARIMSAVLESVSYAVEEPGRVFIVNERGVAIAHADLSYVLGARNLTALPPVRNIVRAGSAAEVLNAYEYENEQGVRVLGAAYPLTIEISDLRAAASTRIDWFVIAEQPEESVYGTAQEVALFSIVLSFLMVVISSVLAVFVAGLVSRPVERLHNAALQFGRGNLSYRADVTSNDEIGELARSFNDTADRLEQTIASLRREERATAGERNKLRTILGGITNAVIAVDGRRRVILFNEAAETLVGLSAQAVLNKPLDGLLELYDGDRQVPIDEYCPIGEAADTEAVAAYHGASFRTVDRGGQEHFINLVSGRIAEGSDIGTGRVLTIEDITHDYITERTKREFVSIAAHQLRTPLTGLSWAVEYLAKGGLNEAQQAVVTQIRDVVRRMTGLVNDLLDVSRIEEGRFNVRLERQPVVPLIERALAALQKDAAAKNIALSYEQESGLPDLDIDASKLEFVFNNIIDNAIKYTPAGGAVAVRAYRAGGEAVVSVKDTGIGIPAEEFERIFTKFFRSKTAMSHHTDGSGIGLYVAKNVVDLHKGRIWFESVKDQGTTFHIALPIPEG